MCCYATHALTMRFIRVVGREYLHRRKCTCTPTSAHLFTPARSSPKRRITGFVVYSGAYLVGVGHCDFVGRHALKSKHSTHFISRFNCFIFHHPMLLRHSVWGLRWPESYLGRETAFLLSVRALRPQLLCLSAPPLPSR